VRQHLPPRRGDHIGKLGNTKGHLTQCQVIKENVSILQGPPKFPILEVAARLNIPMLGGKWWGPQTPKRGAVPICTSGKACAGDVSRSSIQNPGEGPNSNQLRKLTMSNDDGSLNRGITLATADGDVSAPDPEFVREVLEGLAGLPKVSEAADRRRSVENAEKVTKVHHSIFATVARAAY
jgi:hypothetical protein